MYKLLLPYRVMKKARKTNYACCFLFHIASTVQECDARDDAMKYFSPGHKIISYNFYFCKE